MWLSGNDTWSWAEKWPCSEASGHRLRVSVDKDGLYDVALDGAICDVDGNELDSIVSDFLPKKFRHLWPTWE